MNHRVFACVAVAIIACVAVGTGAAAGQNDPGIELNRTVELPEEERTYAQKIGPQTRLVEWDYNDDREGFVLLFETNASVRMTMTEAVQFSEGAGSGRIYQKRLPKGLTEVFVSVPRRGGQAALTMTTPGSVAQNSFSFVSTGETQPTRAPISYETVQILVVLTATGAAGLTFGIVARRRDKESRDYERIL
ncbi:ORF5 [Halorubrum pleomorphic virus 11]|uniref:ORF5 n=1 Tax=Halorubrum pleomorphic virus 11 TaxID=2507577 RepID=A0A410N6V7_9VIRU|nr:ORF5 [Halorubrum pleomorphic virus 11]QAS68906.1 ORF5 [Halorubrum pleomorphic virus 11]